MKNLEKNAIKKGAVRHQLMNGPNIGQATGCRPWFWGEPIDIRLTAAFAAALLPCAQS
jgi:hypothetical protein